MRRNAPVIPPEEAPGGTTIRLARPPGYLTSCPFCGYTVTLDRARPYRPGMIAFTEDGFCAHLIGVTPTKDGVALHFDPSLEGAPEETP